MLLPALQVNKLTVHHLNLPGLVTTCQFSVCSLFVFVCKMGGCLVADDFEWNKAKYFLVYVVSFAIGTYTNMKARRARQTRARSRQRSLAPTLARANASLLRARTRLVTWIRAAHTGTPNEVAVLEATPRCHHRSNGHHRAMRFAGGPSTDCIFIVVSGAHAAAQVLSIANVETVIVFRSCSPLAVAFFDYIFYNRAAPSARSAASFLLITSGAVAYILTDRQFQVHGASAALTSSHLND